MTTNLTHLADELRENCENRMDLALLTLVETLSDLEPGQNVSYSCGNIGVNITNDGIELVDIAESRAILTLEVK